MYLRLGHSSVAILLLMIKFTSFVIAVCFMGVEGMLGPPGGVFNSRRLSNLQIMAFPPTPPPIFNIVPTVNNAHVVLL